MAFRGIMSPPIGDKPSMAHDQNDLAYKLFIELLSYQLASPVRWIETQHSLLQMQSPVQRFIEIGPRSTLARMAKKSATIHHDQHAPSQWSHLQFLSYQDDQDKILYKYPDAMLSASISEPTGLATSPAQLVGTTPRSKTKREAAPAPAATTMDAFTHAPSTRVSLSARHILLAITAQKLRRSFDQISMEKTIRELSGGKSTLQNELTGDLVAEFGQVPEGVEDIPLSVLGEALQGGFSGKPGKQMSGLISKFISSKMPAGFNQLSVQDYLKSRWGLKKSETNVPICLAITAQPLARLPNADSAQVYLDNIVGQYAAFEGISMVRTATYSQTEDPSGRSMMVDSAAFDTFQKEQRDLNHKQLDLLANYLRINPDTFASDYLTSRDRHSELHQKLEQWNAEFDEEFFQGIRPIFNAKQIRQYDSWWNWVREDLLQWLDDTLQSPAGIAVPGRDYRVRCILNRWESSCTDIVMDRLKIMSPEPQLTDKISQTSGMTALLKEILQLGIQAQSTDPVYIHTEPPLGPRTTISASGGLEYEEVVRSVSSYTGIVRQGRTSPASPTSSIPFIHIKMRHDGENWMYDPEATEMLHKILDMGVTTGFSYTGKTVLVTGAGPDSIGARIVQGLLAGGAKVVVTTSRAVSESAVFYQHLFRKYGARGAALTLLPMNQASKQDCEALIAYIYGANSPTGSDLDCIIPFAAIPQAGEPDTLGSWQELALRAMLVNLLRLIGLVRREKEKRRIDTRPTMVILPMSCNEGTFGGDGLYPESKIGLKTLFNRFHSESWSIYVTICGAVIGWTRGTGLMRSSNVIAAEVEKLDVITFTQAEMAFNILGLMTPAMASLAEEAPVYADLTGGFGDMWNVKEHIATSRQTVAEELRLRIALAEEEVHHETTVQGSQAHSEIDQANSHIKRVNLKIGFPPLMHHEEVTASLPDLQGMIDLSRTVVVVGFSELGPWGSSRTRWEMEHQGRFSLEGYVEMAWIMGLIKHINDDLKGQPYVGWIDAQTGDPVRDDEIPQKYGKQIMTNSGVRLIQPDALNPYDPSRKESMHEVAIEDDLPPFESSKSAAEAFKLRHGDQVTIQPIMDSENYHVYMKKGAVVMIPKAAPFHQIAGGKIPRGWDPLRYGIPEDIVQQSDPTTLYALCCVSEALLSAGIKDPYEMYQHIHVSEVANCLGTGGGTMKTIQSMYRDRFLDRPVRGDIILDHFSNTMGAWVNMLLLSCTGPLKTPVGACATAIESLDSGCEAIQTGKCRVAVVGGCDDYGEEVAYEFSNIKATANSTEELAKGRLPGEISRPTTSSRGGFAESAGCGVQIVMAADLALEMGLPIYGIVAYNQMASDQIGRSIPAPGKGILTAAREVAESQHSPLLSLYFRRTGFENEIADIKQRGLGGRLSTLCRSESITQEVVEQTTNSRVREAQHRWASNIRLQDPGISPLKAALATWGLTIDDISVASTHGTSTRANEINEGEVINAQMTHLGRRKGNPLLCVCQKSLTGHPKAAAGAWQLNGCLQMFRENIVPGNRNADNIDGELRKFEHLVYPMDPIRISGLKATMLTSFGFGQKGALNIMVAPKYLFAAVPVTTFEEYRARMTKRQRTANPEFVSRLLKNSLVQVKSDAPWKSPEEMRSVFLNQNSRLTTDRSSFTNKPPPEVHSPRIMGEQTPKDFGGRSKATSAVVQSLLESVTQRSTASPSTSVGVDVEDVMGINIDNHTFIFRNFTPAEREYCYKAPDPRASFAGRWSAKEAVFKSLQAPSKGAGAAMNEIEILGTNATPCVMLHGNARAVAVSKRISSIEVAISHSTETAVAVALATRP